MKSIVAVKLDLASSLASAGFGAFFLCQSFLPVFPSGKTLCQILWCAWVRIHEGLPGCLRTVGEPFFYAKVTCQCSHPGKHFAIFSWCPCACVRVCEGLPGCLRTVWDPFIKFKKRIVAVKLDLEKFPDKLPVYPSGNTCTIFRGLARILIALADFEDCRSQTRLRKISGQVASVPIREYFYHFQWPRADLNSYSRF